MTFSNIIPNWTIFVKEVFWSDPLFRKWRNNCIGTKRKLNFHFLSSFNPRVLNHHLDISLAVSGYIRSYQDKTSSVIAIWNFFGFTDGHERVLEELSLLKIIWRIWSFYLYNWVSCGIFQDWWGRFGCQISVTRSGRGCLRTNRTRVLRLFASLLAGGVARFLQLHHGPGQPSSESWSCSGLMITLG